MKEIKFRGMRIDHTRWVYGDLLRIPKDMGSWDTPPSQELDTFITNSQILTHEWVLVEPHTVGMRTPFKLGNKEIYEGDVLKSLHYVEGKKKHYLYHVVVWNEKYGIWSLTNRENKTDDINVNGNVQMWCYMKSTEFTISGFIMPHPEDNTPIS